MSACVCERGGGGGWGVDGCCVRISVNCAADRRDRQEGADSVCVLYV